MRKRSIASLVLSLSVSSSLLACGSSNDVPTPSDTGLSEVFDTATDTAPVDADAGDTLVPPTDGADSGSDVPEGGDADGGGDGGTPADCLSSTVMDAYFSLPAGTKKCLVAQYDIAATGLASLTWGRHGGPLGFNGSAGPTLVRYEVPGTATGALTIKKTALTVPGVPSGAYWGSQALDVPFFNWTAFSYSGTGAGFPGELVLADSSGTLTRYNVNGFFAMGAISLSSTSGGRIVYTGLSPVSATATTTNEGALYAADSCGAVSVSPRLLPAGDTSCKAPIKVGTWTSGSSGPVTVDAAENLFVVLSKFGGAQELRGFERSTVARGAAPSGGNTLVSIDKNYFSELAADGKTVFYQPNDASTYSALDVESRDYTVDLPSKTVTPATASIKFLTLKTPGTAVALLVDSSKRLWVIVPASSGTASIAFVLRDKSP
jgi:hypothetical protein